MRKEQKPWTILHLPHKLPSYLQPISQIHSFLSIFIITQPNPPFISWITPTIPSGPMLPPLPYYNSFPTGKPVMKRANHILSLYRFTSSKGTWIKLKCHFGLQGPTQFSCCCYLQPHLLSLSPFLSTHRHFYLLLLKHIGLDHTSGPLPLLFPRPKTSRFSHESWLLIMQVSAQMIFLQKGFLLTSYRNLPSHHLVILCPIILLLSQHFLLLKILLLCAYLLSVSPASI